MKINLKSVTNDTIKKELLKKGNWASGSLGNIKYNLFLVFIVRYLRKNTTLKLSKLKIKDHGKSPHVTAKEESNYIVELSKKQYEDLLDYISDLLPLSIGELLTLYRDNML